jgi:hypothetical protein
MEPPSVTEIDNRSTRETVPLRLVVVAEAQHRQKKRPLDWRLVVTGIVLAIALAWLAARIAAGTRGVQETLEMGKGILKGIRSGPYYYWLIWIAMAASVLLQIVARRADRQGVRGRAARFRKYRESKVTGRWSVFVIALCVTILLLTFPWHESPVHCVLWAYAALGTILGIQAARILSKAS